MPPFNRICAFFLLYLVVSAEIHNEEEYTQQVINELIKQHRAYMRSGNHTKIVKSIIYGNSTELAEEPSERIFMTVIACTAMVIGAIIKGIVGCARGFAGMACNVLCGRFCGGTGGGGGGGSGGGGGVSGMLPGMLTGILSGGIGLSGSLSKWFQVGGGGGGSGGRWGSGRDHCLFMRPCRSGMRLKFTMGG